MPIQSSHDWEAAFGFKSSTKETISSGDDDLGFDPWLECSKGLADLMKEEKTMNSSSVTSTVSLHKVAIARIRPTDVVSRIVHLPVS